MTKTRQKALLLGSAEECLSDYALRFPMAPATELLAEFTGLQQATIGQWIHSGQTAKGASLIKLRCFLDRIGYSVKEYKELGYGIRRAAELIAFDLITVDGMCEYLNYASNNGVLDALLRGRKMTKTRSYLLERLLNSNEEKLNAAIAAWQPQFEELLVQAKTPIEVDGFVDKTLSPKVDDEPEPNPQGEGEGPDGKILLLASALHTASLAIEEIQSGDLAQLRILADDQHLKNLRAFLEQLEL